MNVNLNRESRTRFVLRIRDFINPIVLKELFLRTHSQKGAGTSLLKRIVNLRPSIPVVHKRIAPLCLPKL